MDCLVVVGGFFLTGFIKVDVNRTPFELSTSPRETSGNSSIKSMYGTDTLCIKLFGMCLCFIVLGLHDVVMLLSVILHHT